MSYIVAFVRFFGSLKDFPYECYRTDLTIGDVVVVRRSDRKLRLAKISDLKYLNWDCGGYVECKKEECSIDSDGKFILPSGSPIVLGLSSPEALIKSLISRGWTQMRSRQKMYRAIFSNINSSSVAYIFLRKNGLDLQILPRNGNESMRPYSLYQGSLTAGRVVRHSLAHSSSNLYKDIIHFSDSFLGDEKDLDYYFVQQGSSDKRTKELKEQSRKIQQSRDEMSELYEACSDGSGGPAYLGDGIWLTSDGGAHDWGR